MTCFYNRLLSPEFAWAFSHLPKSLCGSATRADRPNSEFPAPESLINSARSSFHRWRIRHPIVIVVSNSSFWGQNLGLKSKYFCETTNILHLCILLLRITLGFPFLPWKLGRLARESQPDEGNLGRCLHWAARLDLAFQSSFLFRIVYSYVWYWLKKIWTIIRAWIPKG